MSASGDLMIADEHSFIGIPCERSCQDELMTEAMRIVDQLG